MARIDPEALYWASFNQFELRIPGQAVLDIAQPGKADEVVAHWAPIVAKQCDADGFVNRPTPDKIRAELAEYGAWDEEELKDDDQNWRRIVWIAAGNIGEEDEADCTPPVPH